MSKKKIIITVNEELYLKINKLAEELSIPKSTVCLNFISKGIYYNDKLTYLISNLNDK